MPMQNNVQSVSFSGHESFPLRFAWLTKAVRHVADDPHLFARDDAVVTLGVGKNMVRSIRHWALRSGVIEPTGESRRGGEYAPTPLGTCLFGAGGTDPYLEDPATVWLIHWQLCSEPCREHAAACSPTTWYWIFNEMRESSFSLRDLPDELLRFAERVGAKRLPSRNTLDRDVACFVRSYIPTEPDRRLSKEETYDSPLTELALLRREPESDRIVLERSTRSTLPQFVFAFAVCRFWERTAPNAESLSFEQIAYRVTSPGQVLRLTENACVEFLEALQDSTQGRLRFGSTGGIRQLTRSPDPPAAMDLLVRGYADAAKKEGVRVA